MQNLKTNLINEIFGTIQAVGAKRLGAKER
jgi:hypothetical protein